MHHRAPAILSQNKDIEIGKLFAEYKDKLVSGWRNQKNVCI